MHDDLPSPIHREILRQEHARLFGSVVGGRVVVLPIFALLALGLALLEPAGARTWLLVGMSVVMPAFFLLEFVRYRRQGFTQTSIPVNLAAAAVGQMLVTVATGGLGSPFIYAVVPVSAVIGLFAPKSLALLLHGFQIACIAVLSVVAAHGVVPGFNLAVFGGGPSVPAPPAYHYAHGVMVVLVIFGSRAVGSAISRVFGNTLRRSLEAQQELLVAHSERVRELTALGGEIAHELKNPLASVKGLATLLAKDLTDSKAAERLAVLRQEAERMQSVLEEFLDFSRPLVPLSLKKAELRTIAIEVAALYEGLAQERGVVLFVEEGQASAVCDPRKVKQILINLVHNALDASQPGAAAVIVCSNRDGMAFVRVEDEGAGLDATLGDVFRPGVTSRAGGSGIGLTIARALARQHGGELELRKRDGVGTVAELRLPSEQARECATCSSEHAA
jgi:signal transduction histidine kinase